MKKRVYICIAVVLACMIALIVYNISLQDPESEQNTGSVTVEERPTEVQSAESQSAEALPSEVQPEAEQTEESQPAEELLSETQFEERQPVIREPSEIQNGIPLLIIRVDESSEAIASASEADPSHTYGTIAQMNESANHSVRCTGTVEFVVPDGYESEYGSSSVPVGEVKLDYIRGRGKSTWQYEKKPYKLQLREAADLFGMGSSKEWGILANRTDRTLMRNRITSWLGSRIGLKYTPQMVPVDVCMVDGEGTSYYLGSYCLCELINVEGSRINIPKLKKNATASDSDITGGYLLSIYNDFQDVDQPESNRFITPKGGVPLKFETPSFDKEPLSEGQIEQRDYIRGYIDQIDALIMTEADTIDEETHGRIAELLDLESLADYWWIQEFSYNGDAFETGSTYMYKEPGGKLYFGPLWDFDLAWRSWDYDTDTVTTGLNHSIMAWTDQLRARDPLFCDLLKERWQVISDELSVLAQPGGVIDQYADEILADSVRDDTLLGTGPEMPERDGYVFLGWVNEEDNSRHKKTSVHEDMTFVPEYVREDEIVSPEELYFSKYEVWIHIDDECFSPGLVVITPEDAEETAKLIVKWSSSDESVAEVDADGVVILRSTGDATITMTLFNGVSNSYLLHVYDADETPLASPESLAVDTPVMELVPGEQRQVRYSFVTNGGPCGHYFTSYESSDPAVASVDEETGIVTALAPGKTTITVSAGFAAFDEESMTADCEVTVGGP